MNLLIDSMLSKLTEDLSPLTSVIDRLHMMGYVNTFQIEGDQMICIESRLGVQLCDVVVDEVCEYSDSDGALSHIWLYALHELKYRRKGLFIVYESDWLNYQITRNCNQ